MLSAATGDVSTLAAQCLQRRLPRAEASAVREVAAHATARSADLDRVSRLLLSTASAGWSGRAATEFAEALHGVAADIPATTARYCAYAAALDSYAGELDAIVPGLSIARSRVEDELERFGRTSPLMLTTVPGDWVLRDSGIAASPSSGAADRAQREAPLREAVGAFLGWWDRYLTAAGRCSLAIRRADVADPGRDRTGWRTVEHALARGIRYANPPGYFALHPSWQHLSDALSIVGTELTALGIGLLFVFPPAGAACLAAASVVSAGQLAVDYERRFGKRDKRVGNFDLAMSLLGAVPVGGAALRGAGLAARVAEAARPAASAAVLERGSVLLAAGHAGARKCAQGLAAETRTLRKLPRDYFRSTSELHGGSLGLVRRWMPKAWDGLNAGLTWPGLPSGQQRAVPERVYDETGLAPRRTRLTSRISRAK